MLYSLLLIDKGVMSLPDENRYYETIIAMDFLSQKNIKEFISHLFFTQGRPTEALFRIVPATLQGIIYKLNGVSPANFDSLKIPLFLM